MKLIQSDSKYFQNVTKKMYILYLNAVHFHLRILKKKTMAFLKTYNNDL